MKKYNSIDQAHLFVAVIEIYKRYYFVENVIAYIHGRDFKMVGCTLETIVSVLDAKTAAEREEAEARVERLSTAVDAFIESVDACYGGLAARVDAENNCPFSKKQLDLVAGNIFEKHYGHIALFWKAFLACQENARSHNEHLLTEFNNYLSHLVVYLADQNRTDGLGHLNRGVLDGYKAILLCQMRAVTLSEDLFKLYREVRVKESCAVGLPATDPGREVIRELYAALTAEVIRRVRG